VTAAPEPYCNHDAAAVRDGVCECGEIIVPADSIEGVLSWILDREDGDVGWMIDVAAKRVRELT
jgi:hypothetical protein